MTTHGNEGSGHSDFGKTTVITHGHEGDGSSSNTFKGHDSSGIGDQHGSSSSTTTTKTTTITSSHEHEGSSE